MARAVLGAAGLAFEFFVLGFDFGVGGRVLLLEIIEQGLHQHGLARLLHLGLVFGVGSQAALLGFLQKNLVHHHLVARALLNVGWQLLALRRGLRADLLDKRFNACFGHRFAVDDGNVLRVCRQRAEQSERHTDDELLHERSLSRR